MKVYSQEQLPTYQVIGNKLRIHWDAVELTKEDMEGTVVQWEQNEAVCDVRDSRSGIIESIMSSVYPSYGAELAAVINGGEDAQAHEALRQTAKTLADGWINNG